MPEIETKGQKMLFTPLFFGKKGYSRLNANTKLSSKSRRAGFEQLEERALLSATPLASVSSVLTEFSVSETGGGQLCASSAIADELEAQVVKLSSAVSESFASDEGYDVVYDLLESGNVRVLGQSGLQQVSTMSYCTVTDSIYIDLWEEVISRWEDVIAVGVEDTTYPYVVDGQRDLKIDDLYLYFGFSDSFSSSSSLGSALNAGYYRDGGAGVAATGSLVFNANYFVANPSESVQAVFYNTALHEIAHALGYNVTHFQKLGLLDLSSETPYALNDLFTGNSSYYYYVGENGVEQYLQSYPDYFISEATSQDKFLMETYSASGSFGAHPSSILGTYYLYLNERDGMTYSISPLFEATITPMTLGVLEDLGYTVNYDFADMLGTPAPKNLTTEAVGKTVVLNWEKSPGDLSNSTSGQAKYQIERLDVTAQLAEVPEEDWTVVATDFEGTTFYDSSVEVGHEYSYRIRASYIRSNEEVGVYRAKAGDEIAWESDESKFCVYVLVNSGSNLFGWKRVLASTTEKSWTVSNLPEPLEDETTLFRVIAVGAILTETDPSAISNTAVSTRANFYVPDGYSSEDWNAIKTFLEIADENGVKNGFKIDGLSYSPDFLQNVTGLVWEEIDGTCRLVDVSWAGYDLVGDLDLSNSSQLTGISIADNSISQVELGSCYLTVVNVASNNLTSLDVSSLVALESLTCSDNELSNLDVSNNLKLSFLDCADNDVSTISLGDNWELITLKTTGSPIVTLDVSGNGALQSLSPWNTSLARVNLPSGFAYAVDLSAASANAYSWVKSNEQVGEGSLYQFDGSDVTVVATLEFDNLTQVIYFCVGSSGDAPEAPSNLVFGELENGRLYTSWIDNAVGEIGYKVYYRVNDGDWRFADSVVSTPEVSATTGTIVERTAVGVNTANSYTFKVCAYKLDSYGNEIESDALVGAYVPKETELDSPANFIAYDYDPDNLTLQLSWDKVEGAAYYEVQYRRSDDGGQTWRYDSWLHAETLQNNYRTAVCVHEDSLYGFRVRAISATGEDSDWTELTFSHVPTLPELTNLKASDYNKYDQTLVLSWNPVESASSYEVQYRVSNDAGQSWSLWTVAEKNLSDVSRIAHDVYATCAYEFRVRARSLSGERSEWSIVSFKYEEAIEDSTAILDAVFEQSLFLADDV